MYLPGRSNPLCCVVSLSVWQGSEREQCRSLAVLQPHFPTNSHVSLGVSPTFATLCGSLQLEVLSLQFPGQQVLPCSPGPPATSLLHVLSPQLPVSTPPTDLDECFFNSLVVLVPCSLIFLSVLVVYYFKIDCYPSFGCV